MKIVYGTVIVVALLMVVSPAGATTKSAASSVPGKTEAVAGEVCHLDIEGNDVMQYDKQELKVAGGCVEIELSLKHNGKLPATAMGHNWILTKDADAAAVANDGIAAGIQSDYVKPGDTRVVAHAAVVGGGQSVTIRFPTSLLKKGEGYTYECTFPGHNMLMHGKLIFD